MTLKFILLGIIQGFTEFLPISSTAHLAIAPRISRSGITITTILLRGIKKESAFKFSFIASISLKKIITLEKFYLFGYYCVAIGLIAVFFLKK